MSMPTESPAADAAMGGLERLTRAVAEGREDAQRLADGLSMAIQETETLHHTLLESTFTTDAVSRAWRDASLARLEAFHESVHLMLDALHGETIDVTALMNRLAHTRRAERAVREVYAHVQGQRARANQTLQTEHRIPCMRCGHRNMPGGSTCEQCRFPLPQIGVERQDVDLIGGSNPGGAQESVYLRELTARIERSGEPEGVQALIDFLKNLEALYVLGLHQIDILLSQTPRDHAVIGPTLELRTRMAGVREMVEAVQSAVLAGQSESLDNFVPWLRDQFDAIIETREAIAAACEVNI